MDHVARLPRNVHRADGRSSIGSQSSRHSISHRNQRTSKITPANHRGEPTRRRPTIETVVDAPVGKLLRPSSEARALFFRSLSTMFRAGVPLDQALDLLARQNEDRDMANAAGTIRDELLGGQTLSVAMTTCRGAFTDFHLRLIKVSEGSGTLDSTLAHLAEHEEKLRNTRMKLQSAITYPLITLAITLVLLIWLPPFVMDGLFTMITNSGQEIPALTRWVMAGCAMLHSGWFYLAFAASVVLAAKWLPAALRDPEFCRRVTKQALRIPKFGDGLRILATARFARSLALQMQVGVNVLLAVPQSSAASGNPILSGLGEQAVDNLRDGETMYVSLAQLDFFPSMFLQMIRAGEEAAQLPRMLNKVAELYEVEVDQAIDVFTSLVEPLVMALMGVIVGVFVLATALPMTSLLQGF